MKHIQTGKEGVFPLPLKKKVKLILHYIIYNISIVSRKYNIKCSNSMYKNIYHTEKQINYISNTQ